MQVIACPECGRLLEPFEITSNGKTWTHRPHCWHPDTEEVYGREMTLENAVELAQGNLEMAQDQVEHAENGLNQLKAKANKNFCAQFSGVIML